MYLLVVVCPLIEGKGKGEKGKGDKHGILALWFVASMSIFKELVQPQITLPFPFNLQPLTFHQLPTTNYQLPLTANS